MVEPRVIDDAHFGAMVAALEPFAGMRFELDVTDENEPKELATPILGALFLAQWHQEPCFAPDAKYLNDNSLGACPIAATRTISVAKADIHTSVGNASIALQESLLASKVPT